MEVGIDQRPLGFENERINHENLFEAGYFLKTLEHEMSPLEDGEIKIRPSAEVEAPLDFESKTSLADQQSGSNENEQKPPSAEQGTNQQYIDLI